MSEIGKATRAVRAGIIEDRKFGGVNSPVYTSSAYRYGAGYNEIRYPRYFNSPNHDAAAAKLAELEQGESALVTSSGMAAISSALLTFLSPGDHVLVQADVYGGSRKFVSGTLRRLGIEYDFAYAKDFESLVLPETRVLYVESPSNPLMNITDLRAMAALARSRGLLSMVDNTFASPINQNPLMLGMDLVLHSGTKYLGGHSDLCCGAVIGSAEHVKAVRETARDLGGSLNAQDCYLLERSLKTLEVRVGRQNENALTIARFLRDAPGIKRVYYPGLEDHPGHEIAAQQMSGFGGMLAFETERAKPNEFFAALGIITPAISLGGVESTICAPADTSHALVPPAERLDLGIHDNLLRLSAGIEDAQDLVEDLRRGLAI